MEKVWLSLFTVIACTIVAASAQNVTEEITKPCSGVIETLGKSRREKLYKINLNGKDELVIETYGKVRIFTVDQSATVNETSPGVYKVSGIRVPEITYVTIRLIGGKLKSVLFDGFKCETKKPVPPVCTADQAEACAVLDTVLTGGQSRITVNSNLTLSWYRVIVGFEEPTAFVLEGRTDRLSRCKNQFKAFGINLKPETTFNVVFNGVPETKISYFFLGNNQCNVECGVKPSCIKEPKTTLPPVTTTKEPIVTTTEVPAETTTEGPAETTTKEPAETTTEEPAETTTEEPSIEAEREDERVSGELNSIMKLFKQIKKDLKKW